MKNAFDILKERGFIKQCTDEELARDAFNNGPVTVYAGFDPTADSLHIGHLLPLMALSHIQKAGHRPIGILGGGTAMVGDPSGKTELRQMLTREQIIKNGEGIKKQISRHLDLSSPDKGMVLDNGQWLLTLNYIDFLRDIGRHFSVNRMLTFESYKIRMESGLSFIEFNYQLLQSYDFLTLFQKYNCTGQIGGDDQWGNIVAGIDLIRRIEGKESFGITFPILTTSSGEKMGKTAKGALWLDKEKVSPYEYFQFWVNIEDDSVINLLKLFTLLPINEINGISDLEGHLLNPVKKILAWEATRLNHGIEAANDALSATIANFGGSDIPKDLIPSSEIPRQSSGENQAIPTCTIKKEQLQDGINILELIVTAGLCSSKSEVRRFIQQGGLYINEDRIDDPSLMISEKYISLDGMIIKLGKKRHYRFITED